MSKPTYSKLKKFSEDIQRVLPICDAAKQYLGFSIAQKTEIIFPAPGEPSQIGLGSWNTLFLDRNTMTATKEKDAEFAKEIATLAAENPDAAVVLNQATISGVAPQVTGVTVEVKINTTETLLRNTTMNPHLTMKEFKSLLKREMFQAPYTDLRQLADKHLSYTSTEAKEIFLFSGVFTITSDNLFEFQNLKQIKDWQDAFVVEKVGPLTLYRSDFCGLTCLVHRLRIRDKVKVEEPKPITNMPGMFEIPSLNYAVIMLPNNVKVLAGFYNGLTIEPPASCTKAAAKLFGFALLESYDDKKST